MEAAHLSIVGRIEFLLDLFQQFPAQCGRVSFYHSDYRQLNPLRFQREYIFQQIAFRLRLVPKEPEWVNGYTG